MEADTTCIEIRATDSDMSIYVQTQIQAKTCLSRLCRQDASLQNEIFREILSKAEGMFLTARLFIETLASKKSLRVVRKALREMPGKLHDLYDQTMKTIKDSKDGMLALLALTWIVFAVLPLRVKELQHAIAIDDLEPGDQLISDDMLTPVGFIVDCCSGLIKIDEESDVIGLVHKTAQEYFDQKGAEHFPDGHCDLRRGCLRYLSLDIFREGAAGDDGPFQERLRVHSLLSYAACNFVKHVPEKGDTPAEGLLMDILLDKQKLECVAEALFCIILKTQFYPDAYRSRFLKNFSGMHLAAYLGLTGAMRHLIGKQECDIDSQDGDCCTPLSLAASEGHEAAVKLLLDTGKIQVDSTDNFYRTPLWRAVANGHEAVARLLLGAGKADPDIKDYQGRTPLLEAVVEGNEALVKMLLETGNVDPNSKDSLSQVPLLGAVQRGHKRIVELLLGSGNADVNIKQDSNGRTPLIWAVCLGHEDLVRMLLEAKANVNFKDNYDQTALSYAANYGRESIVQLLLEKG